MRVIDGRLIFIALVCSCFSSLSAGSLLGRAGLNYTTTQNNFRDHQIATGVVRMTNGCSIVIPASGTGSTHGSIAYFDTCLSFSGAIDLRSTNTMFLLSDLMLDNGFTFSPTGGSIYGYDRALILNGNLNIPASSVFHIGGRIIIDGNGNTLNIGNSSKFLIDTNATLTLRNIVVKNTRNQPGNPFLQCAASGSQLCLENVILEPADDFYFNRGQLFVHNDVAFTGTSAFVYRSCQPSFITSDATFYFDVGTTFSVSPATFTDCPYSVASTTTTNNFILMADQTSQLYLNGCSFLTTLTGLRLTKGTVLFDNMVTIKSNSSFDLASGTTSPAYFIHGVAVATGGSQADAVAWSPDGRFLAVVNFVATYYLQIFRFNGFGYPTQVGSVPTGNAPRSVTWSPDGRFIAFVNEGVTTGVNVVSVYRVNGFGTPTLVGNGSSAVSGSNPYWVSWSPDGRYLATVYQSTNKLEIFSFTGSGTLPSVGSASTGSVPTSVAWSPDGKFIAVVNQTAVTMQIFSVSGGVPSSSPVGNVSTAPSPFAVSWSPDGRFIAVVCNSATGSMQIFRFYGSADSTPSQVGSSISTGNTATCVSWSPDGRFLAVVAINSNTLRIYKFNGYSTPTQVDSNISTGAGPNWVTWSPDGQYIAVANQGGNTMQIFGVNYIVGQTTQAFSNAIVFGNSALGAAYDLNVGVLAGANIVCDGILNYDCVS